MYTLMQPTIYSTVIYLNGHRFSSPRFSKSIQNHEIQVLCMLVNCYSTRKRLRCIKIAISFGPNSLAFTIQSSAIRAKIFCDINTAACN